MARAGLEWCSVTVVPAETERPGTRRPAAPTALRQSGWRRIPDAIELPSGSAPTGLSVIT
jgi:hypothetical protein